MKSNVFQSGQPDGQLCLWLCDARSGKTVKVYVDVAGDDWSLGLQIEQARYEAIRRKRAEQEESGR